MTEAALLVAQVYSSPHAGAHHAELFCVKPCCLETAFWLVDAVTSNFIT